MKKLKKILDDLKGSKRNIGVAAIFILKAISIFWPELISEEHQSFAREVIDWVLFGGTVDAIRRSSKGKEIVKKLTFKKLTQ